MIAFGQAEGGYHESSSYEGGRRRPIFPTAFGQASFLPEGLPKEVGDVVDKVKEILEDVETTTREEIRKEAETGATTATRTPILVIGVLAAAGLALGVVALVRRR